MIDIDTGLDHYLSHYYSVPFEWGVNDCFTFTLGYFNGHIDMEPFSVFIGQYQNRKDMFRILNDNGYSTPYDVCKAHFYELPKHLASRHALVIKDHCLGICGGYKSYFLTEGGVSEVGSVYVDACFEVLRCPH